MTKRFSILVAIVLTTGLAACDTTGRRAPSEEAPAGPTITRQDFPRQPVCRVHGQCPM